MPQGGEGEGAEMRYNCIRDGGDSLILRRRKKAFPMVSHVPRSITSRSSTGQTSERTIMHSDKQTLQVIMT